MIEVHYPHITIDADGVARVGDSRYKVPHFAAEHYYHGWTAEELLRQHTDLRPEEIYAALGYFYDHREELLAELQRSAEYSAQQCSHSTQLSRAELLARQNG